MIAPGFSPVHGYEQFGNFGRRREVERVLRLRRSYYNYGKKVTMNRPLDMVRWLLLIVVCVVFMPYAGAEAERDDAAMRARAAESLHVMVESEKERYLFREPIRLIVTVKNRGELPVKIVRPDWRLSDVLGIRVQQENTLPVMIAPPFSVTPRDIRDHLVTLQPHDTYSTAIDVTANTNAMTAGALEASAIYTIPKEIYGERIKLISNTIVIPIEEPMSVEDRRAYDILRQFAKSVTNVWELSDRQQEGYQQIIHTCPSSAYVAGAYYYLAQAVEFSDDGKNDDFGLAARYFQSASKCWGQSASAVEAQMLAARAYARYGDRVSAFTMFEECLLNPGATSDNILRALQWISYTATGEYDLNRSHGTSRQFVNAKLMHLEPLADALGYAVTYQVETLTLRRDQVEIVLHFQKNSVDYNGFHYTGLIVERHTDEKTAVSPAVIAMLFAERYGECMRGALSYYWPTSME